MTRNVKMKDLRAEVSRYAKKLPELSPPPSGNLSRRRNDYIAITPSARAYESLDAKNIPLIDAGGTNHTQQLTPSSESQLHRELYKDFPFTAVVHTHSPWATTLAVLQEPLPPVHYSSVPVGSEIPVADYKTFGTPELSQSVINCLKKHDTTGCLIANHGLIVGEKGLKQALDLARAVEFSARVYCQAKKLGNPVELSDAEIKDVVQRYKNYGNSRESKNNE